jgi:succinate-acetate transporter protein
MLPAAGGDVVIPLALVFGGLMQIFAGIFEFRLGNTFGMTAFLSYGAFWLWHAFLLLFAHSHLIDLSQAGPTIGVGVLLWGVLTIYLWISTFRLSRVLFFVFLTLWVTLALLGFGMIAANPGLVHAGGWLGIICGSLAMYGSFGIVTNETFGKNLVPLGVR